MAALPVGQSVCVCGIGARTPLGFDRHSSAAAVRCGISALQIHPAYVDKTGQPMRLASGPGMDPWLPPTERILLLLSAAVAEAIAGVNAIMRTGAVPFLIGLPEPRPGLPTDIAERLTGHIRSGFEPTIFSNGHAAGLMAIEEGARLIAEDRASICLVASADSYLNADTLEWLDAGGRLLSAENRNGFSPGEAAGACLLASEAAAEAHELPILARVVSVATRIEEITIGMDAVCIGAGLTAAVSATAQLADHPVAAIYCDLNGERYRSEEWAYTLLRIQQAFVDAHAYISPADCWGDVGAASGPLYAALSIAAAERGYSKGSLSMLLAGSDGGYRSAAVIRNPS